MSEYKNGKIYGIYNDRNNELMYIGSTRKELNQRRYVHIKNYGRNDGLTQLPLYQHIDDWDYFSLRLIEKFECNTRKELLEREAYYIKQLRPKHNHILPFVSQTDKLQYRKEYRKKNLERIKEYMTNYRKLESSKQNKKIQDKKYSMAHKEDISVKNHEKYLKNKDEIDAKSALYYESNKQVINEKLKVKKHCDICNCDVRKCDFNRHEKSKKHQQFIQSKQT